MNNKSKTAFIRANKLMPGGVNSPVRAFKNLGITPPCIYKGKGPYIYDIDGNKYIDFCNSWGALILGHSNSKIINAVKKVLNNGTSFGATTKLETELAENIIKAVPSIEMIRFVSSGTEAVMSALRVARAYTGRNKIIKFDGCYHGHADSLLVKAGSGIADLNASSLGVPAEYLKHTISIPFNDFNSVEKIFKSQKKQLAAVIVEPIPMNMGLVPPKNGFLKYLRKITKENNVLLIFDEVITGFRIAIGGAQEYYGIAPDLTCLGKIIGGGFPSAAYGGAKKIMSLISPSGPVYQAGTLSGNSVAMTAGITVIKELNKSKFYSNLNSRSEKFILELKKLLEKKNIQVNHMGSAFTIYFNKNIPNNLNDVKKCDINRFSKFYKLLLSKGIYLSPSQYEANFISFSHKEKDLMKTLEIIGGVLRKI